tara:strand:+ start:2872 stop:4437 length:1566 start_codon:yes stop_codon:yes gene_type:complete
MSKTQVIDDFKIFDTKIPIFYPLIGLFVFGNILFIFNFFTPLNSINLKIVLILILFFNLYNFKNILKNTSNLLTLSIFQLIITLSIFNINFQYDAGFYHLNYQNWIKTEKLVVGLSNLHTPFGLSSISDYIASMFWFGNNFALLHLPSIIFLTVLLTFLSFHIFKSNNKFLKNSSILIIFFGILDNFGFNGGLNGFITISGIIKPDLPFAILFYLFTLLFLNGLIKKSFSIYEINFLSLLLFFSFQYRITSIYLFPFLLFTIFNLVRNKEFKLSQLKMQLTYIVLFGLWIVKSFLLTSCLLYPITFTCLNTKWGNNRNAVNFTDESREFNFAFDINQNFLEWFREWIVQNSNSTILKNFVLSFFIILFISYFFSEKLEDQIVLNFVSKCFIVYTILGFLLIWIFGAPSFRFLYGSILFSISCLTLLKKRLNLKNYLNSKYILTILMFASAMLIPRLDSYKSFFDNPLELKVLEVETVRYIEGDGNWVYPEKGDQCWINKKCIPSSVQVEEEKLLSFKAFTK